MVFFLTPSIYMIVLFIIHVLIHVLKSFHAHEFGWTAANQNWALPKENNTTTDQPVFFQTMFISL